MEIGENVQYKIKKLKKGFVLNTYKERDSWSSKNGKYFLQVNVYKQKSKKFELMTTVFVGGKSEIQLSQNLSWKKEKEQVRNTILIVEIHKDGSVLESRIENAISNYNQYWSIISKSSSAKYYGRLFLKQTD